MVNQASTIQALGGHSPMPSPQTGRHCSQNRPKDESAAPDDPGSDIITDVVGNFGIWQLRTILIIFLCKIPAAWFMACIIFTAPQLYPRTEYICDTSYLNSSSSSNYNVSDDQCYVLDESSGSRSECAQFNYVSSFDSLIMQFNLVCLRDIFIAWTQYWHLFGVLIGGITATKMMLAISPRSTYCVGAIAQIVCGVITGYATDFSLHCAFRCLSAVCCAIMFTAGQTICKLKLSYVSPFHFVVSFN